jgi:hypothetical protein
VKPAKPSACADLYGQCVLGLLASHRITADGIFGMDNHGCVRCRASGRSLAAGIERSFDDTPKERVC